MLSDQSIKEKKDDLLQRYPFAEKIARIIASQHNKDPLVISINGPWGDGKSTVFEFLETELKQKEVPTLVFNPWRYPHENDLLRAFFVELAETLDDDLLTKGEKLAQQAREKMWWFKDGVFGLLKEVGKLQPKPEGQVSGGWFSNWIIPLLSPFVSGLITNQMVGNLLSQLGAWLTPSIQELRIRLKEKLMQNEKRIAILLDDPDRLEAEELFALFRLIKLTADFPYTTFVLAMDYDAVAKTVGSRFGSDEQGRKFLEKIVQVPLRLPAVPRLKLTEFALELIDEVLRDLRITLSKEEKNRFAEAFGTYLMPSVTTPRLAKRFANVVRFALGMLPGEVNSVDVMLVEGIRLFHPDVFGRLVDHLVSLPEGHLIWQTFEHFKEVKITSLERIVPDLPDKRSSDSMRKFLQTLFPFSLDLNAYGEATQLEHSRAQRLSCDDYFLKYLAAVVPDNDVADADVDELMSIAASGDVGKVARRLHELLTPKRSAKLMTRLWHKVAQMNDVQKRCLAEAVTLHSDTIATFDDAPSGNHALGQASYLVAACISRLEAKQDRPALASKVVINPVSFVWGCYVIDRLPHEKDAPQEYMPPEQKEMLFPTDVTNELEAKLASSIMEHLESSSELPPRDQLGLLLMHCRKGGLTKQVQAWTQLQLEKDPSYLIKLVDMLLDYWSSDNRYYYRWPGNEKVLERLQWHVDPKWLAQSELPLPVPGQMADPPNITIEDATIRLFQILREPPPPASPPGESA